MRVCAVWFACLGMSQLFFCFLFLSSKMSPNRVFDRSFNVIRNDAEVQRRYGDSLKGSYCGCLFGLAILRYIMLFGLTTLYSTRAPWK
jgi:hypothetical protein